MDADFCKTYTVRLQGKVILSANGQCQLWTGSKKGKFSAYGVINCRFECGYRTVTVHRLSYMFEHKITRVEPGLDANYLCHNSLCLTASHISMEPHSINNNRQYCVSQNVFQCNSKTYIFRDILNHSVVSTGITRGDVLKELEVCDFDNSW